MTLVGLLAAYALTLLVAGPALLNKTSMLNHAPRWAVAAWLSAIGSALFSLGIVVMLTLVEIGGHWALSRAGIVSCIQGLQNVIIGRSGTLPQLLAIALSAVVLAGLGAVVLRLGRGLKRMLDRADDHASGVRLVGRRMDGDIVVVDAVEPAAYCVAGRAPTIVVTSAAIAALDGDELAAVLSHERAHLRGRHALVIAVIRGLAAVLPMVALLRAAAARVPTLLEMCADDVAVRVHGRGALLSGLLAISQASERRGVGLAAAEVSVLARAERLASPRSQLTAAGSSAVLSGTVAMMVAGPLTVAVVATIGALWCVR